jgi:hypothetical protein
MGFIHIHLFYSINSRDCEAKTVGKRTHVTETRRCEVRRNCLAFVLSDSTVVESTCACVETILVMESACVTTNAVGSIAEVSHTLLLITSSTLRL